MQEQNQREGGMVDKGTTKGLGEGAIHLRNSHVRSCRPSSLKQPSTAIRSNMCGDHSCSIGTQPTGVDWNETKFETWSLGVNRLMR